MDYNNLILSIDWLQLNLRGVFYKSDKYTYKLLDIHTGIFKKVTEVKINDLLIGTVAHEPFSNIMKLDTHIVKFDNKLLYFDDLFNFIDEFIKDHCFKLIGITRLDLAIDFNNFKNNLKPENLILYFLKNDYLRVNKGKYKLIGEQFKLQIFEYLRFGSNTSEVSVYLYNKTIEMAQKKFKQYIFNKWIVQGLDMEKNIWRLEFSIKSNSLRFEDTESGEIIDYSYENIKNKSVMSEIFKSLMFKYFRFKYNDGQENKHRMKDIILFDNVKAMLNTSFVTKHEDYTRMDKIFIKMLEKFNCSLREQKKELSEDIKMEIEKYAENHRLENWYNQNIKQDDGQDNYIQNLVRKIKKEKETADKIKRYNTQQMTRKDLND